MRSLEMPHHDFDVGERCVYCLTDMRTWPDEQKTDEHIIPPAINGELIIRHGACLKCAELSNKGYENIALNNDLLFPRRILELRKSRNRGSKNEKPPKPLPPIAVGNHTMTPGVAVFDMAISKEQYPQAFSLIMFPRAGFLAGADRTNGITSMRVQLFNLARKRDTLNDVTTRQPFANGPFAKMVAKIGYCYAVAKLGFDAFDGDAIRELLAGKRDDVYNFVGNVEKPEALSIRRIHALYLREQDGWLTVLVHLFASCNAKESEPSIPYEVAVGRKK